MICLKKVYFNRFTGPRNMLVNVSVVKTGYFLMICRVLPLKRVIFVVWADPGEDRHFHTTSLKHFVVQ